MYAAPEVIEERLATAKSDVFAFSMVTTPFIKVMTADR
jgi:hypothetical protein